jgi:Ca2+-binding EF-hand superfamily protein
MYSTDAEIAFRTRKLRTVISRIDVNNDGYVTPDDFEAMAKKVNELTKATSEQAESCLKSFRHAAELLGFTPETTREEAGEKLSKRMATQTWEEQQAMCDSAQGHIFDAVDTNGDGHISLEEFKASFQVLAPGTPDECRVKAFNLIDVNKNGEISREEFLAATFEYLHGVKETELSKILFGPLL